MFYFYELEAKGKIIDTSASVDSNEESRTRKRNESTTENATMETADTVNPYRDSEIVDANSKVIPEEEEVMEDDRIGYFYSQNR